MGRFGNKIGKASSWKKSITVRMEWREIERRRCRYTVNGRKCARRKAQTKSLAKINEGELRVRGSVGVHRNSPRGSPFPLLFTAMNLFPTVIRRGHRVHRGHRVSPHFTAPTAYTAVKVHSYSVRPTVVEQPLTMGSTAIILAAYLFHRYSPR